jgi:16S rRNA (uracil1498-N3)-methyltransferase
MPSADFVSTRLYLDAALAEGARVALAPDQLNYLRNVLRLDDGAELLVFDGRSGEFGARLRLVAKHKAEVEVGPRARPQPAPGDLWYLFAPLKHARLDYMAQKAVEMGASRLQPVLTRRTQASRVKLDRLRANAIEAAEQCGVLGLPEIVGEERLERVLDGWPAGRRLVFCDEAAEVANPVDALRAVPRGPLAVLVGPEGGFDEAERRRLLGQPFVTAVALGPRVLRADTAAVAALAVVQATLGDWG